MSRDTERVDVMVCTYNSEKYLEPCLSSIETNIPVRKLWIIDNYSTDRTQEIAVDHGCSVVKSRGSLADSRNLGFSLCETPLFVNVDSDIVLCDKWFSRVLEYMKPQLGAVWGVALNMNPVQHRHYQEAMYSFKAPGRYDLIVLGNMLARKEAVEGLKFPEEYRRGAVAGEDYYIKRHIEKRGFETLTVPVFVNHFCNPPPLGLKTFWGGASTRLSEHRGIVGVLSRAFLSVAQGGFAAIKSRDALVLPYWVRYRCEQVYGWLHWDRYYNLRRKPE